MSTDLSALATNAKKLDKYIDKNEKREQDRKDEQLYDIIERKVKKEEHKREKPRSRDGTLKKCKRLFKEGASPEVLTKLEESLREQEKYYRYYVQCFLPVLNRKISKELDPIEKEEIGQVISEITYNSKYCFTHNQNDRRNSEDSGIESDYSSDAGDDYEKHSISNPNAANEDQEIEKSNEITNSNALLLKAIKNGNNRKFKKYLKGCADISSIKAEEGKNILHLIASLEKKQKCKFLGALIKTVTEEDLAQLINSKNQEEQTPLHQLLQHIKEKNEDRSCTDRKFEKTNRYKALELFLQNGADITVQDKDGKNALHYIALLKGEQKVTCLELISNKDGFSNAVNTTNKEEQIPLHLVLQRIQEKNKEPSLKNKIKNVVKKEFKDTGRFKALELFLQNGADITVQDKDGKNALHYIASFKGRQKVACLELILGLIKERKISEDQLREAVNAPNGEENTPLELALKKKAEKRSIEYLPQGTIFDTAAAYDNTTKFCTMLLEIGADPCSLELKDPKFHTKKYYLTLRDLKDYSGTPQKAQEKAKELKEKLEEKYHCKTASKKCKSDIKEAGSGIRKGVSVVAGFIDPAKRTRELLAITITITVIAMVTFAFFQGQMAIGAAIPIIATAGVICLTITLGFDGIKKLFEKSTNKAQDTFNDKNRSNSTTEQNQASKNPIDNDQQNLGNDSEDLAAKRQQNQSEHTENPATKMSDVSILRQFMNKLVGNVL
ncbi:ankyrin repeat domain-containing protein [Wolbachia endosymbiont (group A) of Sicus ferrugineus]|uniref:ankyrin repeat domain-containing protein n=1 Tax=Wolbachia endosymbiont (group A) of Sicus ferrugineus TaxID=2954056 RepID=UPI002232689E|nr:ankyrin repeat domain-containing protein [Wolbachia endosymbiont (group A) of Sicus ferrugineus]